MPEGMLARNFNKRKFDVVGIWIHISSSPHAIRPGWFLHGDTGLAQTDALGGQVGHLEPLAHKILLETAGRCCG
jgi:hypothetical protein